MGGGVEKLGVAFFSLLPIPPSLRGGTQNHVNFAFKYCEFPFSVWNESIGGRDMSLLFRMYRGDWKSILLSLFPLCLLLLSPSLSSGYVQSSCAICSSWRCSSTRIAAAVATSVSESVYCHNCGVKLGPSKAVKFCPNCGTERVGLVDAVEFNSDGDVGGVAAVAVDHPSMQTLETFVVEDWLELRHQEVSENTYRVEEGFWMSEKGILSSIGEIMLRIREPDGRFRRL